MHAYISASHVPRFIGVDEWSAQDVAGYRTRIAAFEREWRALNVTAEAVPVQVDYRLIGSAIARVRWELEARELSRREARGSMDAVAKALHAALHSGKTFHITPKATYGCPAGAPR